jgi:hypothetical protein
MLWIGSAALGNSAEERVHVLAMQKTLADLARIVEHRIEGRHEVRDAWEWSEGVTELLARLDQARELRGCIVGKGLARLPDHLPKELPGRKPKPKLPEPIRPVNTAEPVWHNAAAEPSKVPPDPPMYFPPDLWSQTNVILLEAKRKFPQPQILELCEHVIREMTPLFCKAVKAAKISANAALNEGFGGMADLLRSICRQNYGSSSLGGLSDRASQIFKEIRDSGGWLTFSKAIAEADRQRTSGKQRETNANQQETPYGENREKTLQTAESKPSGRPRKDADRKLAKTLKAEGKSWKEIAEEINTQTGQNKSPEAYRGLLKAPPGKATSTGKNGQE